MAGRLWRYQAVVAGLVVIATLAGCAGNQVRERAQAQAALVRWASAVEAAGSAGHPLFVPVGDLTGLIGGFEADVGDNDKLALYAGMFTSAVELPTESPGDVEVRWDDGTARSVRTTSAAQAVQELRATGGQECKECTPLQITAASLSNVSVQTSRGPASAPVWEFTLVGTKAIVTRLAVSPKDRITVTPLPWDANNPPVGLSIESATGTVGGTQLTVSFVGAPRTGKEPCGADYTAEALESDTAVVIIVTEHANPTLGACTMEGATRTATATLAAPLGDRTVLEVGDGLPVSVTLTP